MVLFAGIGFASAVFGHSWPRLKSKLPSGLSITVPRVASDFRWWLIVILVGFAFGDSLLPARIFKLSSGWQAGLWASAIGCLLIVVIATILAIKPKPHVETAPMPQAAQPQSTVHIIATAAGLARRRAGIEQAYENFHAALAHATASWSRREHLDNRSELAAAVEQLGDSLATTKPPSSEQVERAKQQLMSELRELRRMLDFEIMESTGANELSISLVASPANAEILQLRFEQIAPYVQAVHPGTVYRIGLRNPSDRLIRNVQISLWKMEPTPRELVGATDLPYPVARPSAGQFDQPNCEPCDINPKDEGFFELAHTWTTGPPDHRLIVNRIATKGHKLWFEMHRDEMWHLYYRVSCADHHPIDFVAVVSPLNENILVQITETV